MFAGYFFNDEEFIYVTLDPTADGFELVLNFYIAFIVKTHKIQEIDGFEFFRDLVRKKYGWISDVVEQNLDQAKDRYQSVYRS